MKNPTCWRHRGFAKKAKMIGALLIVLTSGGISFAQDSSSWKTAPELYLDGFADAFYVYDFNEPVYYDNPQRQFFLYNHNRHNEFNVNFGLVRARAEHSRYRISLGLQTGTYAVDNYADEPPALRNIFEAYTGVALNKAGNLWLDAGIFPSHLGFESLISIENPTLTRSLVAESSPYFLSGVRLSFELNEQWSFAAVATNGWQRITRQPGNSLPGFGTKVQYQREKFKINYSTFIGTDAPDWARRMRYFHNLYAIWEPGSRWQLTGGFDLGFQQSQEVSSSYNQWLAPILIARYKLNPNWYAAARAEYYYDPLPVIIRTPAVSFIEMSGFSFNLDYRPIPQVACRLEGRYLSNPLPVFRSDPFSFVESSFFLTASIAVQFEKKL